MTRFDKKNSKNVKISDLLPKFPSSTTKETTKLYLLYEIKKLKIDQDDNEIDSEEELSEEEDSNEDSSSDNSDVDS